MLSRKTTSRVWSPTRSRTTGSIDCVVNMAGKVHWSSVLDMAVAEWREAVLSFPTAGMLTTKHAAKAMIAGGRPGSIIHLLSTAAHFGQPAGARLLRRQGGTS